MTRFLFLEQALFVRNVAGLCGSGGQDVMNQSKTFPLHGAK